MGEKTKTKLLSYVNGGYLDFALTYMGEWDFGNSSGSSKIKFYGVNTYLLISKGNLDYDVIEILDIPNQSQFNINIFDWDFDGLQDFLIQTKNLIDLYPIFLEKAKLAKIEWQKSFTYY
mgnify:CR=1 FL=1